MFGIGPAELIVIGLIALGALPPICIISSRAGFGWQMGLLATIPYIGGLLVQVLLATREWPNASSNRSGGR